jgi:hypothetical protein
MKFEVHSAPEPGRGASIWGRHIALITCVECGEKPAAPLTMTLIP